MIKFCSNQTEAHLWYLYAYIAYLVCLPFLKAIVKNLHKKYYYYMIFIAILFNGIVPIVEYCFSGWIITLNGNLKISWLTTNIVLYPCLGYFMHNMIDISKVNRKKIILLWIFNLLSIIVCCLMTNYKGQIEGILQESTSQSFHNSFVILNCIAIFITTKWLFEKKQFLKKNADFINSLGKCTFCVYLFHMWIMNWDFIKKMLVLLQGSGINYMISVFLYCIVIMLMGYILTFSISKIPILKKLVGF